jgi:hypothetical protein
LDARSTVPKHAITSDRGHRWPEGRGEKPGDLPVQFPTKFEMIVNRRTAKALGLAIPPSIPPRADEAIE